MTKEELELALKSHGEEISKKQAELKVALEAKLTAKAAELKAAAEKADAMQKAFDAELEKGKKMQEQLDELDTKTAKLEKSGIAPEKEMNFAESIKSIVTSEDFKIAKKDGFRSKNTFEVKADTSVITGTVNRTVQNLKVEFAPARALAFYPELNQGYVGKNKSRVLWMEGAYTSNAGYVGEGTGAATADSGTAVEKSRAMAKISAKLPLTADLLEDADYIASKFRMKMAEQALLFTDKEYYAGDGSDGVAPNHIYGIVGQSTTFNATTAGLALAIKTPNIGDVVDAAILQAKLSEQRGLNVLWINPADFQKFKYEKDANGEYLFVKDVNGKYTIAGLKVIESTAVTADTLTVADTGLIQAWWKRTAEVKFSQMNGTDFLDDAYLAVLFLRTQCVIEGEDKTAVIHVPSIATAITDLTKV